jgi:hypothetical protein
MCLFYLSRSDGKRCDVGTNDAMCNKHSSANVTFHELIGAIIDCERGIAYDGLAAQWSSGKTEADVIAAIVHVCSRQRLLAIAKYMNIKHYKNANKLALTQVIIRAYRKIWEFAQNPRALAAVCAFQRKWQRRVAPINDTDPFTCEELSELDPDTLFYYKDGAQRCYGFVASELDYYVRTVAPCNPYTREEFSGGDLARLAAMMQRIPRKEIPEPESLWRTPADAYTYVLHYYEQEGFYLNIDQFVALTPQQIIHVFEAFHVDIRYNDEMDIMDATNLYDAICTGEICDMHFAFAKELLRVVRGNYTRKFYLLCNILLAVSVANRSIARTLPNWVLLGAVQVN